MSPTKVVYTFYTHQTSDVCAMRERTIAGIKWKELGQNDRNMTARTKRCIFYGCRNLTRKLRVLTNF